MQRRFNNLLSKSRLFAFAKSIRRLLAGSRTPASAVRAFRAFDIPVGRQGRSSRGCLCAAHEKVLLDLCAARSCGMHLHYVSHANIIVTNAKLQAPPARQE